MNRRRYLTLTASSVFVAGCNSSSSDENDTTTARAGNPYFEEVTVSGPDSVSVGDPFSLTIEAANTGGRSGDFTTALTANPNAFAEQVYQIVIEDVSAGEIGTTRLESLVANVAGEFRFVSEAYNAEHTLTSDPLEGTRGDSLVGPTDLRITLEELSLTNAILYDRGGDDVGLAKPDEDSRVFAVAHISVENQADEERQPVSRFTLATNDEFIGSQWTTTDLHLEGDRFRSEDSIQAGGSRSGWLVFDIPANSIDSGVQFAYNYDYGEPAEAYWAHEDLSSGGTPPEFDVSLNTEEIEAMQSATLTAEVSNSGSVPATYNDLFEFTRLNSDVVVGRIPVQVDVSGGQTAHVSGEIEVNRAGRYGVSTQSIPYRGALDVIPLQAGYGETVTTPSGLALTVSDLRLTVGDSVGFESGGSSHPDGQWMLAHLRVENDGEKQYFPPAGSFSAVTADPGSSRAVRFR